MSPRARVAVLVVLAALLLAALWVWLGEGPDEVGAPRALPGPMLATPAPADDLPAPAPRELVDLKGSLAEPAPAPPVESATSGGPRRRVEGRVLRASTGEPWLQRFRLDWTTGRQDEEALAALAAFTADEAHLVTDERGGFDFDDVPACVSGLTAVHFNTKGRMGSVPVTAGPQPVLDLDVPADGGWALRGTVRDGAGRVLAGATVSMQGRWRRTTLEGEQFLLHDLPYEPPDDVATFTFQFAGAVSEDIEVPVPPGPRVVDIPPVVLRPAGAIVGLVLDEEGLHVPACAYVQVVEGTAAGGAPPPAVTRLRTESRAPDGRYRLEGVPPGTYVLAAGLPVGQGRVFSEPVSVFAGADSVVDFVLGSGAELRGRVELASGDGIGGQQVTLIQSGPVPRVENHALTAPGGRYVFRRVTPGSKRVVVAGARTLDGAPHHEITLAPDEVREGLDFRVPLGVELAGVVVNIGSGPVEGARVVATPIGGRLSAAHDEMTTGPDGHFRLTGLPPQMVTLRVLHDEHESWARRIQPGIEALQVRLDNVPVIWGVVSGGRDEPVTEFSIRVPGGREVRHADVEDERGFFRVRTRRSGPTEITVEAPGYHPTTVTLEARGLALLPQPVNLTRR